MSDQSLINSRPRAFILIQLWYAYFWRTMLWLAAAMVLVVLSSFAVGMIAGMIGVGEEDGQVFFLIIGGLLGLTAGLFANCMGLKGMLGKRYSGHRLVLLTPDADDKVN